MTGNWKVIRKVKKGTPWEITQMPSSFEVRESWGPGPKLNHLTTPAAKKVKLSTKEACFYQNQGPGWEKHQGHIGWCLPKYWTHRFSWTTFKVFNSNTELMTIDLESTAPDIIYYDKLWGTFTVNNRVVPIQERSQGYRQKAWRGLAWLLHLLWNLCFSNYLLTRENNHTLV